MDSRKIALSNWCLDQLDQLCSIELQSQAQTVNLIPVSGDASFRKYYRIENASRWLGKQYPSIIAMDAPPDKEDSQSFLDIANDWYKRGLKVPKIIVEDLNLGFLMIEDFGNQLLLDDMDVEQDLDQARALYKRAIKSLVDIQKSLRDTSLELPPYDETLLYREMYLFSEWLVEEKLKIDLLPTESNMLEEVFALLAKNALEQSQACVHRDYHSRNLMRLSENQIGIIDFQDAVKGPVSYDLVSLLRDCYVKLPNDLLFELLNYFYDLKSASEKHFVDHETFFKWFDLMGLQRHLKASGIFARLSIRDGKHGYLEDIPRTLDYIISIGSKYGETRVFAEWVSARVKPLMVQALLTSGVSS